MASVYLVIRSVVSKEVPDTETLSDLEKVAEKLRDKYPLAAPGWECLDGNVQVHSVGHDWPELTE